MSVLDWQTAIRMRIENTEGIYPAHFNLHYKMPRGIGVTTFLVGLTHDLMLSGKHVSLITKNQISMNYITSFELYKNNKFSVYTPKRFYDYQWELVKENCADPIDYILFDSCVDATESRYVLGEAGDKINILAIDTIDF